MKQFVERLLSMPIELKKLYLNPITQRHDVRWVQWNGYQLTNQHIFAIQTCMQYVCGNEKNKKKKKKLSKYND